MATHVLELRKHFGQKKYNSRRPGNTRAVIWERTMRQPILKDGGERVDVVEVGSGVNQACRVRLDVGLEERGCVTWDVIQEGNCCVHSLLHS